MKNESVRAKFECRAEIIDAIRAFFKGRGYLEVETPKVVAFPGQEPNLVSFETAVLDERGKSFSGYLITSPEFSIKKMLSAGFTKVFEMGKCFRNGEPWGGDHNPEFTMLEWYACGMDYRGLMDETEELVCAVNQKINNSEKIQYQGRTVNLARPWTRMSVAEAFKKWTSIDLAANLEANRLAERAREIGIEVTESDSLSDIFFKIFLSRIETEFPKDAPLILYDYPTALGALARRRSDDPRFAERFEVYIAGMELANAFSELTDPVEQRQRFLAEQEERGRNNLPVYPIDEDFLSALATLPPSAGIALGVDRLVMLLLDAADINDVIAFGAGDIFSQKSKVKSQVQSHRVQS